MEFKHPKFYKELRRRNKLDQAISKPEPTGHARVRPGPGLKPQASSSKPRLVIRSAWKLQAPSSKPQASSPVAQGSSFKPQASSSKILSPLNKKN